MERVSTLNIELRFGEPRVWQRERKSKYPDRIPVSGKTPKTQEKAEK